MASIARRSVRPLLAMSEKSWMKGVWMTPSAAAAPSRRRSRSSSVPGTNFVRTLFLDPVARDVYDDIEARQAGAVASLRALAGPDVDDPSLTELVGELSVKSPEFRRLWSRHDVKPIYGALAAVCVHHPQLGPIELHHQKLEIPDTGGQILGLLYAEPGSKSEQAVAMLAATALTIS